MLISCPYCGPRDVSEFTYQGDGNRTRPDPASTDAAAWNAYVFDRSNVAGEHREFWQHSGGCRSHLTLLRNTVTHKVSSARMVRDRQPIVAVRKQLSTTQTALEEQALTAAKTLGKLKPRAAAPTASKRAASKSAAPAKPARKPRSEK
jgi:heterotetrameric sarcosine oxidase delta subunit